jgi:hypothetical protein
MQTANNSTIGAMKNNNSFSSHNDSLLNRLKQQERIKEMSVADQQKYKIEADDDRG